MKHCLRLLLPALLALGLATSASAQTTVDLNWSLFLTNNDATIQPGDTVRWTWTDSTPHDVFSSDGGFTSSAIFTGIGTMYSVTFPTAGSYPYHCTVHGVGNMNGTITVVAAAPVPALSSPLGMGITIAIAGALVLVLRRRSVAIGTR